MTESKWLYAEVEKPPKESEQQTLLLTSILRLLGSQTTLPYARPPQVPGRIVTDEPVDGRVEGNHRWDVV